MGMRSTCSVVVWLRGVSGGGSEMSHADVLVCDGDQQQEAGLSFSKYGRLKLSRLASNVPTNRSMESCQLRPELGDCMDWM